MMRNEKMSRAGSIQYRNDIDGLRAIAVLAVIFFHLGYLPGGYLGVDIFFAISGFLITSIVYREALGNRFSIVKFYLRRIRRIIPLVLFTTFAAMAVGVLVMLPDDLENLSQSVIATNLFANNILLLITTGNYWDVVNEYKPLMHTWSLGVEEQFYLAYPLIFLLLNGKRSRGILPVLVALTIVSLSLFLFAGTEAFRFYSIQYRFFELSLGGIGAIVFRERSFSSNYKVILLPILLLLLVVDLPIPAGLRLILVVIITVGLLVSDSPPHRINRWLLENKPMVGIGRISYSLYMWHQIVLAYTRYSITHDFTVLLSLGLIVIIMAVSVVSFYLVEQPFRDKEKIGVRPLLLTVGISFVVVVSMSGYLYIRKGIIRDVPELGLYQSETYHGNIHNQYNKRVYEWNRDFISKDKIRVLVIGNSFARDWANVLTESAVGPEIEISYLDDLRNIPDPAKRIREAEVIFFSDTDMDTFRKLSAAWSVDPEKCWNVGTKSFGTNNGIFYIRRGSPGYCEQRTKPDRGFEARNELLKKSWGDRYIDILGALTDPDGTVPVFTPDCRFLSQDCRHLTRAGAVYLAERIDLSRIFSR
jgi:peptidoglycan/LPS O-acetylase OafA/YrhL